MGGSFTLETLAPLWAVVKAREQGEGLGAASAQEDLVIARGLSKRLLKYLPASGSRSSGAGAQRRSSSPLSAEGQFASPPGVHFFISSWVPLGHTPNTAPAMHLPGDRAHRAPTDSNHASESTRHHRLRHCQHPSR